MISKYFKRQKSKLEYKQRQALDTSIHLLADNPSIGKQREGEMAGVYSYNYHDSQGKMQLIYKFDKKSLSIIGVFKLSQSI